MKGIKQGKTNHGQTKSEGSPGEELGTRRQDQTEQDQTLDGVEKCHNYCPIWQPMTHVARSI